MEFQIPSDLTALNDEELAQALNGANEEFAAKAAATELDDQDLARLEALADFADSVRAEQAQRAELAESTADKIDKLTVRMRGTESKPEPAAEPEQPPVEDDVLASANVPGKVKINLTGVRRNRPLMIENRPQIAFTASASAVGVVPEQLLSTETLGEAIQHTATNNSVGQHTVRTPVARYQLPMHESLIIEDGGNINRANDVLRLAADQSRLPEGDLVASGGWCAPSETVFDLVSFACADLLWSVPEVGIRRGGLRFFRPPALDVTQLTFRHSEAADIAGEAKPCYRIPCPEPHEVRCEALGACLEAGILTDRAFPELTEYYKELAIIAHEIDVRRYLFDLAREDATVVQMPESFGTFAAVFNAVALQVEDFSAKYSLCDGIGIEVVAPHYLRGQMLADLARRNGVDISEINPNILDNAFAALGVRVQYVRGINAGPAALIGGNEPATDWPGGVEILLYAAGTLQLGRGPSIELGTIYSPEQFQYNDHTALFTEECVALVDRGPETRLLQIPVCADGASGAQVPLDCPVPDWSPAESPAES